VRAAPRDRDARALGARARARRCGIPYRRCRVRRRAALRRVHGARHRRRYAADADRTPRPVVDAAGGAGCTRGLPGLLVLFPAVRSAQPRPDARQTAHGHSRRDGYRAPDHVRGGRGAQPDPHRRRAPVRPGGPRLRAVPSAEQAARRHRGRHGGGARPTEGVGRTTVVAERFVTRKRDSWEAFRTLAARAERIGLKQLGAAEIPGFAARYREVAADLARARTYGVDPRVLEYLERVVSAGHNALYGRHTGHRVHVGRLVLRELPAAVVAARAYVVTALLVFAVPAAT